VQALWSFDDEPDVVFSDINMSGRWTACCSLSEIKHRRPDLPVGAVTVTAYGDDERRR
jgi:hypothetical protein